MLHLAGLDDSLDGIETSGALTDNLAQNVEELPVLIELECKYSCLYELIAPYEHRQFHGLLIAFDLLVVLFLLDLPSRVIAHLDGGVVATTDQSQGLLLIRVDTPDLAGVLLNGEHTRLLHQVPYFQRAVKRDREQLLSEIDPNKAGDLLRMALESSHALRLSSVIDLPNLDKLVARAGCQHPRVG